MITSRIPHPPGSRFLVLHLWAVKAIGKAAAAVLADMDFLDRVHPGTPVANRKRLVADLDGLVGRDAVDDAISQLVELGWIIRHERVELGRSNLQTFVDYSLNVEAITNFLASDAPPELLKSGNPELLKSGRKSGRESGVPSVYKRTRKETTTTQPPQHGSSSDFQALELPSKFDGDLKSAMLAQVRGLDAETAQAVIDEAIGIQDAGALRVSLPSLTAGLVKKVENGEFKPAAGVAVRQARRRAAERQAQPPAPDLPKASPDAALRHLAACKTAIARKKEGGPSLPI